MAHNIEIVEGKAQMVWVGEEPWHGLGKKVHHDLTPAQMQKEAGLDWSVKKISIFGELNKKRISLGDKKALVRISDDPAKHGTVLTVVGEDWNPVQNDEAFQFFHDFVMAGNMEMHTAGSLKNGQIVWALAKIKDETFEVVKDDPIEGFLLFSNFHQYGTSNDVRMTPIRVVCNNTLDLALMGRGDAAVRIDHRRKFDADLVKSTLNLNHMRIEGYRERCQLLASRKAKPETVDEYFRQIYPATTEAKRETKELSRVAQMMHDALHTQPGADKAPGTWWPAFNAATYVVDHMAGKSLDGRLASAWYGDGRNRKAKALELAVEFANAA